MAVKKPQLVQVGVDTSPIARTIAVREPTAAPIEVLIDGLANGPSGFAVHLRDWARHLALYGAKVHIPPHRSSEYEEIRKLHETEVKSPIELLIYPGCSFHPKNPDRFVIGYTVFETYHFPTVFRENAKQVDEIWTASKFCFDRFADVGIPTKKMRIFPEGVDTELFNPYVAPSLRIENARFVFGLVCGWSERKGIHTLLRAFMQEFDRAEGVVLYVSGGWYAKEAAQKEIEDVKHELGITTPPSIFLDWRDRNDFEMPALFNSFDAFCLPTKGEGYGRPIVEALSCAIPTIATDCPPVNEVLDDKVGYPIAAPLIAPEPRADWICEHYRGADFFHPSENHLRYQMRSVVEDYELAQEKAERGREKVKKEHNTAIIAEGVIARLHEITRENHY